MKKFNLFKMLAVLFVLITGINTGWAGNNITYQNCHFYFNPYYDATNTVNQGYVQMAARKYQNDGGDDYGWYTAVTTLSAIGHTRLYYTSSLEGTGWSDSGLKFHGWAMISNSTSKSNGDTEYWTSGNSTWYSEFKTYGLASGNTYLFIASSSSNGKTIDHDGDEYISSGYSGLNKAQTVKKYTSTDGGSTYSEASINSGTVTISAYKFTNNGTVSNTSNSATLDEASETSASKDAAYTGEVTVTASANTGYTFVGWFDVASGGSALSTEASYTYNAPNSTHTIYARFDADQYGGTINANGGDANTSYTATYGLTSLAITVPTKTGYHVKGYYTNAACTTKVADADKTLIASTSYTNSSKQWTYTSSAPTLYAGWDANTYYVQFNANGGTGSMSNQTLTYNASETLNTCTFTKSGYNFDGWAATADGSVAHTDGATKVFNLTTTQGATVNLYAKWSSNSTTISFNVAGGSAMSTVSAEYGEDMPAIVKPTKDDYVFVGIWDDADGPTGSGTQYYDENGASAHVWDKVGSTATLYVYWTPEYTVAKAAKVSGVAIPGAEYTPTNVKLNNYFYTSVSAPTITGYTFASWTLGTKITTSGALTDNPISVKASADTTLTANYTYTNYKVTYPEDSRWTFDLNDTLVAYKSTGHFTVAPAAGYSLEVSAVDESSASVELFRDGSAYSFVQGTKEITIVVTPTELTNKIAVINGTTDTVTAKVISDTATVTAHAAETGQKFSRWYLGAGVTLVSTYAVTDRTIKFTASQNSTVTAAYTDRDKVTVHFAKPHGWSTVTAVFSNSSSSVDPSSKTTAVSTSSYEGATYYNFSYYTDNNGEGDDLSDQAQWNQVVFSDDGSTAWDAQTITNGNYYAKGGDTGGRSSAYAEWYLRGNLNTTDNWSSDKYLYPFSVDGSTAVYAFGASKGDAQYFRLYRISTNECFAYNITSDADVEFPLDAAQTLSTYAGSKANKITTNSSDKKGVYLFTLSNLDEDAPNLTVTRPEDAYYAVEISAAANGSITTTGITELGRYMPTTITAAANAGYRFKEWVTTGGAKVKDATSATTTATATSAGTITATFTNKGIVYLDLSAFSGSWGAGSPHVYFYSGSYWDKDKGSGSKDILYGGETMTRIGTSYVWYYDYSSTLGTSNTKNYIAFTDKDLDGYANFKSCCAIYRGDFYPDMNTFVPQSTQSGTYNDDAAYYNNGYWMKYNEEEAGYNLLIRDGQNKLHETIHFTTANVGERDSYTAVYHVDGAASGQFELIGHDQGTVNGIAYAGTYYKNTGTVEATISRWEFTTDPLSAVTIEYTSNGDYVFTLECGTDGKLWVSVEYPLEENDFRLHYTGLVTTEDVSSGDIFSDAIPHLTADGTSRVDTVSFFITKHATISPALSLQECTDIDGTDITWDDSEVSFNPAAGTDVTKLESGVYNFEVTQTKSSGTISFTYKNLGLYTGNYYVRTDSTQGGWLAFKQADNIMHETNYEDAGFNRYFCRYIPSGNVKFCVANEYNSTLTKQVVGDINANGVGTLAVSANTRFEYDNTTNVVSRSYLGASNVASFLFIEETSDVKGKIMHSSGTALTADTAKFIDQQNWVYMLDVKAKPGAEYKLKAKINGSPQYFVGDEDTDAKLLGGTGESAQTMHLVYDFKNNHLIKAWIPSGVVSGNVSIEADVMLMREGQEHAKQLMFNTERDSLKDVLNVYGVLGFKKSDMIDDSKSSTERTLYWISFPFDVKLKEIFGFGTYGEDYIVRRYNGAKRAEKGWFAGDGTTTFWETMNPDSSKVEDNTMRAYEGYMVALDKGLKNSSNKHWTADGVPISEIYLYFPSSSATVGALTRKDYSVTLDSLTCTIDRTFTQDSELAEGKQRNHKNTDSNWRVIGVGSLCNARITDIQDLEEKSISLNYYSWLPGSNSLSATPCIPAGQTGESVFAAGHAVMVQWAGKITWKSASVPAALAPKRVQDDIKNYDAELILSFNGEMEDRTYVVLQENASPDYVLNEDLYKATNANVSNIYAFAGAYDCGVSRMPLENTTVQVGVLIRKNGNYTFSMPSNFDGTVTLIDTYTQTRTNLAVEDYEVYLNKGTIEDRFLLEININNAPTAIDGTTDGEGTFKDGKAHKFIMNGQMFILENGRLYDARGSRVK